MLFLGTCLQVRPVDRFSRMMGWWLKRRGLAQGCAFFGIFCMAPHLRGQKPKKNILGAWIGVFKPNSRNRITCILSKLLHWFLTKFCTMIKTTKCRSWMVPTQASQIQDGGRPPSWKNRKIISRSRFERFLQNFPSVFGSSPSTVCINCSTFISQLSCLSSRHTTSDAFSTHRKQIQLCNVNRQTN